MNLISVIKNLADVPDSETTRLHAIAIEQTISKGENFLLAGSVPQKFAFVEKGLFRYYYADDKGNEFTKGFFPENNFIVSYSAMIRQSHSFYTIEALEDSIIYVIDYQQWQKLYGGHPGWSQFLIKLLEKGYMKKESRERELLLYGAEARYKIFINEYPQLEHRIKQHQIASYLGITPVALSRIRKTMALTK